MNETGRAAVIVPVGVLSRSYHAKRAFREYIVNNDMIEAIVLLLPNKILSYTMIQTVLLVLNKNKQSNRKQQVLFINAEEEFTSRGRSQNYLTQENIDSIVALYEQSSTDTEDVKIASLRRL